MSPIQPPRPSLAPHSVGVCETQGVPALLVTTFDVYKTLHVLAAVVWVGGDFMIQVFAFRVLQTGDRQKLVDLATDIAWIGTRVLVPASFVVVLFGILTAQKGGFDFGQTWISFGLLIFAVSFVIGAFFLGPESGRIARLVAARGADAPEVADRIKRVLLVSRIDLALLILVVIDMVVKPT
jgi:uncharacterized membrane protein